MHFSDCALHELLKQELDNLKNNKKFSWHKLQRGNVTAFFLFFAVLFGAVFYLAKEKPLPVQKKMFNGVVLENRRLTIRLNSFNLCKVRLESEKVIEARCNRFDKEGDLVTIAKEKGFGKNQIYMVQISGEKSSSKK